MYKISWGNMFSNIFEDSRAFILKCFPERQIYLRSGGEVSYYILSTRIQCAVVGTVVAVSLWCLLTLFNLIWGYNPLSSPSTKTKLVKAEYERLLDDANAKFSMAQAQLEEQQATFEKAAKNFEQKHAAIAQFTGTTNTAIQSTPISLVDNLAVKGEIMMSPVAREVLPRNSRRTFLQVAELELGNTSDTRLAQLDVTQNTILQAAEEETLISIEQMRAIIQATDMDVREVLSLGQTGTGGPLINVDELRESESESTRITNMKARAYEAKLLTDALNSTPLGHPVNADHYRTSPFGVRKDPFTRRPAMHEGLDYASYRSAPIVATADGVVTYAGRKGSFGKLVQIDHGHGFITRYAHLEKTFVKRGQKVKRGDKLGGMGSTGRSTSTHVHYEVRFQGRAFDPEKFLKAGRHYVQQKQQ